jgi:energy-coupling factor transporter transmembrane protein EcfT
LFVAVETPFSYRTKRTFLHRTNAAVKLLCLLVFSAAAFLGKPPCAAALSLFLAALSLVSGLGPAVLLRGSRPIVVLALFTALGRAVDFSPAFAFSLDGLLDGLVFLWSMMLSFCAGSLFFAVTTQAEVRGAFRAAERALTRPAAALLKNAKAPCLKKLRYAALHPQSALALSLMLGFIPRFFAEWETLQNASRARAGKRGAAEIKRLVPPAVGRMMDKALETAIAMEARGALLYGRGRCGGVGG